MLTGALALDMDSWSYDADNDVYCLIGVSYCENPEADDCESMGIYVPGACFTGTQGSNAPIPTL